LAIIERGLLIAGIGKQQEKGKGRIPWWLLFLTLSYLEWLHLL